MTDLLLARSRLLDYLAEHNISPYWRCRDKHEQCLPLQFLAAAAGRRWVTVYAEVQW